MKPRKTRRTIERARAKSLKWNRIRWDRDRAERDAGEAERIRERELARVLGEGLPAAGDYVGTLQWHGADGKVRRWTVRRGPRAGQITVDRVSGVHTITWLLDRLRRRLVPLLRAPIDED